MAHRRFIMGCAFAALLLAGCAGSVDYPRALERDGALSIERASGKPYDYVVRLASAIDFGYNTTDPETRRSTALKAMAEQCLNATIVGEETIKKVGTGPDYLIQIRCDGRPASPAVSPSNRNS